MVGDVQVGRLLAAAGVGIGHNGRAGAAALEQERDLVGLPLLDVSIVAELERLDIVLVGGKVRGIADIARHIDRDVGEAAFHRAGGAEGLPGGRIFRDGGGLVGSDLEACEREGDGLHPVSRGVVPEHPLCAGGGGGNALDAADSVTGMEVDELHRDGDGAVLPVRRDPGLGGGDVVDEVLRLFVVASQLEAVVRSGAASGLHGLEEGALKGKGQLIARSRPVQPVEFNVHLHVEVGLAKLRLAHGQVLRHDVRHAKLRRIGHEDVAAVRAVVVDSIGCRLSVVGLRDRHVRKRGLGLLEAAARRIGRRRHAQQGQQHGHRKREGQPSFPVRPVIHSELPLIHMIESPRFACASNARQFRPEIIPDCDSVSL